MPGARCNCAICGCSSSTASLAISLFKVPSSNHDLYSINLIKKWYVVICDRVIEFWEVKLTTVGYLHVNCIIHKLNYCGVIIHKGSWSWILFTGLVLSLTKLTRLPTQAIESSMNYTFLFSWIFIPVSIC